MRIKMRDVSRVDGDVKMLTFCAWKIHQVHERLDCPYLQQSKGASSLM